MKINTKRILSFVLSCILICSGLQVATAEKENKLDRAKNLLQALHIIDDDTDALVTREQFADIFVRANNLYQEGYVGANPFDDTEESQYAASIHMMRDYGYINGVGNNLYAPLDYMMTRDIAKLYVSALGLDTYSGATGKDYMEIAYEVELFDGIGVSDYITMDNLILMTYNFLKAPVGVHNFTQQVSYKINYDTDALYEKFDVYKITGQVIQNDLSGIWSPAGAPKGYVSIKTKDGEFTALEGESGIGTMLGHTLDIYIFEGEDEYSVVCYEERDNEQSVLINIKNIDFDRTNNNTIFYSKEGRSSTSNERLASFPAYIINGVYYDAGQFDIDELRKYSGQIKLISSNRDDFDIIIVDAYTNYFVKNVEHYDGEMRIYDSGANEALVLNEAVYNRMDIYFPNGAKASPFELQSEMLLTVAKSFGTEKYVKIHICDAVNEGVIVNYDIDDKLIVMEDGTRYEVSPSYDMTNISVGAVAQVYMDKFGDVAWIEYDKTAIYSYAYFRSARINTDEEKVMIKVVAESQKFTTMYLTQKPVIDGMKVKNADAALAELTNVDKIPNLPAGEYPIRYRLNEEGEIKEIDTPRIRNGFEDRYSFRVTTSGANVICSNDKILGKQTPLSANTVMFLVPEVTATEERDNPAFYNIGNSSLLNTGGDNTYTAFQVSNNSLYADLVIRTQTSIGGGLNHDNVLFLVDKIRDVYDEKSGELRTKVYGLEGGVRKEYFVHEQCNRDKLQGIDKGDVLRFSLYSGEISAIDKVFVYNDDVSTNTGKYHLPTGGQKASSLNQIGTSYYYSGYVIQREGRLIEILPFDLNANSQDSGVLVPNIPDWSIETRRVFQAPSKIMIYDPSLGVNGSVYIGDLEDIPTYEDGMNYVKVIVRYRSRSAQEMIVLKDQSLFR